MLMPSDETYKFGFCAARFASQVSIDEACEQQRTLSR
jgi:hypothetical protein